MADEPTTTDPQTPEPAEPDLASEVEKWKALSRKNEQAAKANAAAAKRLEDLENNAKSETERLTARAEAAERLAGERELASLRLEVAFDKGLSQAQAKRLVGGSREELEADADEILHDFPIDKQPKRPSGDIGQGVRGGKQPAQSPRDAFASLIQTRQ